ncbi:MAG: Flavodoxin reductase (ferredoxin-NADPH reductase) family 1 [Acidimicrobiales bacterium]|nr:Flavodoxin reductase (ferredoxin-NADPH reductase) family 1 [Acidimicrobiales bacterium]
MSNELWWYTARAAGIVGWALLAASVLWGLFISTKALGRKARPNWMLDLHRFLGGFAVIFTAIHVLGIMMDSYIHFGLAEVLVPFTASWNPNAVAGGIVAMYLLIAIEVSSLLRKRIPKRAWRAIHFAGFPLFVASTLHAFMAGTDASGVVFTLVAIVTSLAVVALTIRRVNQARRQAPTVRLRVPPVAPTVHRIDDPGLVSAGR